MPVHYPTGPWVRTQLYFQGALKQYQNDLWWYMSESPPSDPDLTGAVAAVDSLIETGFLALMNENCEYLGCNFYLNNGSYTQSIRSYSAMEGAADGNPLPDEVAGIVTLNSEVGTREGVGRIFVGGIDNTLVTASRFNETGYPLLQALSAGLKSSETFSNIPCIIGLWSRKLNVVKPCPIVSAEYLLGHRTKRRPRR